MSEQFSHDISQSNLDDQFQQDEPQQLQENQQFIDRNYALEQNKDFYQILGMFFCATCNNMLEPLNTKVQILQFKCKRCGNMLINFKNRQDKKCMLYSKSLQAGTKKIQVDSRMIFDPSMPRITIQCPQCSYHEAVYLVAPDDGERKIVLKLICARGAEQDVVKCGTKWDLDQELQVYENTVKGLNTQNEIEAED